MICENYEQHFHAPTPTRFHPVLTVKQQIELARKPWIPAHLAAVKTMPKRQPAREIGPKCQAAFEFIQRSGKVTINEICAGMGIPHYTAKNHIYTLSHHGLIDKEVPRDQRKPSHWFAVEDL